MDEDETFESPSKETAKQKENFFGRLGSKISRAFRKKSHSQSTGTKKKRPASSSDENIVEAVDKSKLKNAQDRVTPDENVDKPSTGLQATGFRNELEAKLRLPPRPPAPAGTKSAGSCGSLASDDSPARSSHSPTSLAGADRGLMTTSAIESSSTNSPSTLVGLQHKLAVARHNQRRRPTKFTPSKQNEGASPLTFESGGDRDCEDFFVNTPSTPVVTPRTEIGIPHVHKEKSGNLSSDKERVVEAIVTSPTSDQKHLETSSSPPHQDVSSPVVHGDSIAPHVNLRSPVSPSIALNGVLPTEVTNLSTTIETTDVHTTNTSNDATTPNSRSLILTPNRSAESSSCPTVDARDRTTSDTPISHGKSKAPCPPVHESPRCNVPVVREQPNDDSKESETAVSQTVVFGKKRTALVSSSLTVGPRQKTESHQDTEKSNNRKSRVLDMAKNFEQK